MSKLARTRNLAALLAAVLALVFSSPAAQAADGRVNQPSLQLQPIAKPAEEQPPADRRPCYMLDLSTGTTQPFVTDAVGTPDPDWFVTASPDPNFAVPAPAISITPVPSWATATPGSNWVDPDGSGYNKDASGAYSGFDPSGNYVFATSFTVNGALYTNAVLQVNGFGADNQVQLVLDGTPVGGSAGFGPPNSSPTGTPFSVPLTAGAHTLEARVSNISLWMGLFVNAVVTADCRPDMAIEKTSRGQFVAGQPGTYMLTVSNVGLGTASGPIYVTDTLPAGATFVSAAGSGWTCTNTGLNVTCTHPGPVPPGTSLPSILITMIVPQGPVVTNCAAVDLKDDANWENNRTCVESPVDPGRPATICGFKFNDLNGNGVRDTNEPGLPNWTIQIKDAWGNIMTVTTNKDGSYCFRELKPGTYIVSEVQKPGWVQTAPAVPGTYTMTLNSGVAMSAINFGNRAKQNEACCLTFRFPVGAADNFNATNNAEPASPSPGLIKYLSASAPMVGFDYQGIDHVFATTITLPQGNCIDSATLRIHVRPNGSSLNSNDTLVLNFISAAGTVIPGTGGWGASFGTGNPGNVILPNTWDSANYPSGQWITLNLASLPGGGNVLPALNSLRFLDLIVQDDTSVDAAVLTVKFCECAKTDGPPKDEAPPDMPLP